MSTSISKLRPASNSDVIMYTPYYSKDKHRILPLAISLYKQGKLEGERKIEGSDSIEFVASWDISSLPSEITRCRMQFDRKAELSYELGLENSEFIDYLIEIIINYERTHNVDFPRKFYSRMLNFVDETI